MAADSDPESEVFEITDFTTASEWERFISRVEEVLNDWKLIGSNFGKPPEKGEYTSRTWDEKSRDINFADFRFSITHHYLKQECVESEGREDVEEDAFPLAMQDLLCMNNDFPPRAHCLVRWYGVREFVVISPGANCEAIISESKCNLLLSSVSIALANTGCQVPVFVQIQQKWRKMYSGECQGPGVRTNFEMVHLRKVPSQYNHLSGLLDVFKGKIGCPLSPLPPINIAIRFTYILQDWQQYTWPQQPPDFDGLLAGEVGGVEFGKLPFGPCEDPIRFGPAKLTFLFLDLDPLQAPHWSVRVRKADNPQCLLGDFLMEFFKLCSQKESTEEILGRNSVEEEGKENSDITQALSKLTEPAAVPIPKLSVSNMVHSARKRIRRHRRLDQSPLSNDMLNSILLVRDTHPRMYMCAMHSSSGGKSERDTESDDYNLFNLLKSAPSHSLTFRLALCMCLVNFYHGGVRAVAHLWQEFVLEMRYRWENNCLVYGKFVFCRRARDSGSGRDRKEAASENGILSPTSTGAGPTLSETPLGKPWDSWSDSEDEFFECLSDTEEIKDVPADRAKGGAKEVGRAKPEGRLQPHGKLTLLNTDEPLYVPVTQEPAPMTEDVLEEQSEVLAKLGTSAEGAHLRARMQSACLLSDMESFKAANPGCSLEDFVRWYSPRDYVEEEVTDDTGQTVVLSDLSARMKIPGNMWVEAWETAKATPARRQKRLFDDTKEAERVLHYLAVQKPADLVRHLLPCVLHAAMLKVKEEEASEDIHSVRKALQQVISQASKLLRHPSPDCRKLEDIINQIMALEAIVARARSLKAKFGVVKGDKGEDSEDLEKFVSSLLEEPEVAVTGAGRGPAGTIIHKLFGSAQRAALLAPLEEEAGRAGGPENRKPMGGGGVPDFPPPAGREILLRTCVPRPAPYSRALPQRLYCVLMREDFRLAGAFSSDTSFF
uniref:Rab3 GTPase-activating protein catalytic subunit n=1 Tax=Electrophorus electricus TaxID=8005 RepID=A0A4W4HID2_ELEEL